MIATQLGFTAATTDSASSQHLPAHECVARAVCFWCGAPCEVEASRAGHIRVPHCGCRRVEVGE